MNLFQLVTVPVVAFLVIRSAVRLFQGTQPRGMTAISLVVWLSAGIAIYQPELTKRIADMLGIGRGADLVLYALTISYLLSLGYFYNRFRKLETQLTEIVRHIAIMNVRKEDKLTNPDSGKECQ